MAVSMVEGQPQEVTPKMMREVYDVDCDVVQIPGRKKPLIMFKEISWIKGVLWRWMEKILV